MSTKRSMKYQIPKSPAVRLYFKAHTIRTNTWITFEATNLWSIYGDTHVEFVLKPNIYANGIHIWT